MKWWTVEDSLEPREVDDVRNVDGLENVLMAPFQVFTFQGECEELGELWKGT